MSGTRKKPKLFDQDLLLERASEGASQFHLSQAPWKLELNPLTSGLAFPLNNLNDNGMLISP